MIRNDKEPDNGINIKCGPEKTETNRDYKLVPRTENGKKANGKGTRKGKMLLFLVLFIEENWIGKYWLSDYEINE